MKTKITTRNVKAFYTTDTERIARLIAEADKLNMPEQLYREAADIAASVQANIPTGGEYRATDTIAVYVLKYAYTLSRAGQLVEASPKPRRRPE